jgi:hypothetical protein
VRSSWARPRGGAGDGVGAEGLFRLLSDLGQVDAECRQERDVIRTSAGAAAAGGDDDLEVGDGATRFGQQPGGHGVGGADGEQEVFGANGPGFEPGRLVPGDFEDVACRRVESFEHAVTVLVGAVRRGASCGLTGG